MPLRLAILECDTPQPQTRDQYKSYTGVFSALLAAAAKQLDPPEQIDALLSIKGYDVVNKLHTYPDLDQVDVILITGSRHTAYDGDPWIINLVKFTQEAINTGRVRVLGICFGHQIVGRALDVPVTRHPTGWELAVTEVDLTDKGKSVFGLDKMRIQQLHRDVVDELPENAYSIGSNKFCSVQGMYSPGRYLTVQGHPEFTNEIISEILFNRHTVGIFTDDVYQDGIVRARNPHDGVAVGKAFLRFMKEG